MKGMRIMKMIHTTGKCKGCGAKPEDPECKCEWATCYCGAWDCWVREDGTYHCDNCDYESDPKRRG